MGETFTELVDVVYEEPFSEETEKAVRAVFAGESAVSTYSRLDRYHEMKTSENQVKVLGGGLGGILAVLAVMNYLNVMAASVQARRDELATLESIGMTVKQTKKMLRIEGAGYALLSIAGAVIYRAAAQLPRFSGDERLFHFFFHTMVRQPDSFWLRVAGVRHGAGHHL